MRYSTLFGKAVGWAVFILQPLLEQAPAAWGCMPPRRGMLRGTQGPDCSFLSIPLHQSFGAECLGLGGPGARWYFPSTKFPLGGKVASDASLVKAPEGPQHSCFVLTHLGLSTRTTRQEVRVCVITTGDVQKPGWGTGMHEMRVLHAGKGK